MVEPVTAAAAASTAADMAAPATDAAAAGGGFISNIIGAPFRAIGSFVSAPFRAIASLPGNMMSAVGGAASGVWGSLSSGLLYTGVITALKLIAPEGWRAANRAIGGDDYAARTADMVARDGIAGVVIDSAKQGFGVAAAGGALSGALGSGGVLAGGAVVAGVAAVAYGALHSPSTPAGAMPRSENAKA